MIRNIFSKINTDESLHETASHGSAEYPFQYYLENIWEFDFHCIDWHWHPEVEFVYIKEGTAICYIGSQKKIILEGMGIFINSRVVHRFEAMNDTIIPNIVFSPTLIAGENSILYRKYIKPVTDSAADFLTFDSSVPWQDHILTTMCKVFACQEVSPVNEWKTVSLLMELWKILYDHLPDDGGEKKKASSASKQARLQIMMQYVHENFRNPVTLQDIADSVSVSQSSALEIFKNNIHTSPIEYLIEYRLKYAAGLLLSTEKKVGAIAEEAGFGSSEYFCRKFRQLYQMTPNEYRKSRRSS